MPTSCRLLLSTSYVEVIVKDGDNIVKLIVLDSLMLLRGMASHGRLLTVTGQNWCSIKFPAVALSVVPLVYIVNVS